LESLEPGKEHTVTGKGRWGRSDYQRIASVEREGDELVIGFEDGSRASLHAQRLLPPNTRGADWASLKFNQYEILVSTADGQMEVPWSTVRILTDEEYSAHLAAAAEELAKRIGLRIKELRQGRRLTSKELAERAGITPRNLSRLEHGRHDVVLTTLQRILAAIGYSLKDLVADPRRSVSAAS
jgi:DNA-binding Xre family transcriptional regulator